MTMEDLIKILSENASIAGKKRTTVTPLLWAVVSVMSGAIASYSNGLADIAMVLTIVLCVMVVAFLVAYFYFMFTKPDYLQSEKYRLEKKRLDIARRKGNVSIETSSDLAALDNKTEPQEKIERV